MSITSVSDHFAWSEAACHSGAEVPLELQPHARRLALSVLEPLRERWGAPVVIISWYRTPRYNAAVGGAPHSQHVLAKAVDCRPAEITALPRFKSVIEEMIHEMRLTQLGGLGWYPGRWVHLDVGPSHADGSPRRWVGNGIGSEVAG